MISSVDSDARHGRKSSKSRFDGYKAHIAIDPESEIITAAKVTPGNVHDAQAALDLIDPNTQVVYGDNAYGSGELLNEFQERSINTYIKARFPVRPNGMIPKNDFVIDFDKLTVTCPIGITLVAKPQKKEAILHPLEATVANAQNSNSAPNPNRDEASILEPMSANYTRQD